FRLPASRYNPAAMQRIAILGAGDLGAAVARRAAEQEIVREVLLADADEGRAKGKALDLLQSGPVEGYDTRIAGASDLPEGMDATVVADPPELEGRGTRDAVSWLEGFAKRVAKGPFLV